MDGSIEYVLIFIIWGAGFVLTCKPYNYLLRILEMKSYTKSSCKVGPIATYWCAVASYQTTYKGHTTCLVTSRMAKFGVLKITN